MPPESLSVSRPKPKTRKERVADLDCSSKQPLTAEQLRLNPMAGMEDDEEEKKGGGMTAEQKRLNPMAAAGGGGGGKAMAKNVARAAVQNTLKRSVTKSDMT